MCQSTGLVSSHCDLEIIPPLRVGARLRCECCGERKPAGEFEEDCFGICLACLESDVATLPWEMTGTEPPAL